MATDGETIDRSGIDDRSSIVPSSSAGDDRNGLAKAIDDVAGKQTNERSTNVDIELSSLANKVTLNAMVWFYYDYMKGAFNHSKFE